MKYMHLFPQSPSRRAVMPFGVDLPDTFPCVCKYVVLSNADLNIIRSLSARIWPAGTGNSVLLLLSTPSIRRTVVLVSSSPSGHRPVCIAVVKLTSGRHMTTRRVIGLVILAHVVVIYTVSEIIHVAYCTASV